MLNLVLEDIKHYIDHEPWIYRNIKQPYFSIEAWTLTKKVSTGNTSLWRLNIIGTIEKIMER